MPIIEDVEREQKLQAAIKEQQATIHNLRLYIQELEEHIRNGRRKLFGPSSEKLVDLHPALFTEAEAETPVEPGPKPDEAATQTEGEPRKRRRAFRIPPELPRVEIFHDLSEAEKVCPHDGAALKRIHSEVPSEPPRQGVPLRSGLAP